LGGDGYLLTVKFTTLGAAVQQLVLNPFPEVDRMGLGVKKADGTLQPLELIPEGLVPSFSIYHYASADAKEERPLDTLGTRVWTVLARAKGDKDQSISFT